MASRTYPLPDGLHPASDLDLRPDAEVDATILNAPPITTSKNIFFFWHAGFHGLYPYTLRNIRAWHRRFSSSGWSVRVLDTAPGSPNHISNYLDVADSATFPRAFIEGRMGGEYAVQHTSDLVRWPLLLKYGGVYADVGLMQIGDLNALWEATVADPASPFEAIAYNGGGGDDYHLTNYFFAADRGNEFFERCQALFLALWDEKDGGVGEVETTGMHASALLKGTPMQAVGLSFVENGVTVGPEETSRLITDYIIQAQVSAMVMGLVDEKGGWDGPRYVAEHVYGIEFMVGSQLINQFTMWNGARAWELMSLKMPVEGEEESDDQKLAREIVQTCLRKSFGWKLGHGIISRMIGHTLGTLWRKHEGSDVVPGTYAAWLRYAMVYWTQDELPPRVEYKRLEPFRRGALTKV